MKKKLLLAVLPALMVLSSCSAGPRVEKNTFVEDTLAHEEIFGDSALQQRNQPLRTVSDVDSYVDSEKPSIGIQTNDELADGFAIRFVSAIKIDDDDLGDANISWVRSIFYANHRVKKSEESIPVENLYTSIASNGGAVNIEKFNQDNHTSYDYFAVYTIRGINKTNDAKCVINANLVVNGVSSKVLSTTVDQVTQFTFNNTDTGYFGVRKTASGFETFYQDANPDGNHARFLNIPIEKDESFIIVNRASDWFEIHGYDKTHLADNGDNNFGADAMEPFAKAKLSLLSYSLFLSKGDDTPNYIYSNRVVQFFLVPNDNWHNDSARFALNVVVDNGSDQWFSMNQVGSENLYVCNVPFSNIDGFGRLIFCRMNPASDTNNWDNKWNQTNDLTWDKTTNKFTIDGGSGNQYYGNWSLQPIH